MAFYLVEFEIEQASCYWLYAAGSFMLGLKSLRASEAGLGQVVTDNEVSVGRFNGNTHRQSLKKYIC